MTTLSLAVKNHLIGSMFSILQDGFMVRALVGRSIGEFLHVQYGLSREYIAKRISTIFLNGEPVDDVDTAILREGSVLALSGAMPGLVGAVMRSGSYYASFRDTITHRDSGEAIKEGEGVIRVKLFNIVMSELGAGFLRRGIYLNASALRDFLSGQGDDFWQGCREILLNRKAAEPDLIRKGRFLSEGDLVFFSVNTIE
jgi:hypothetical protein